MFKTIQVTEEDIANGVRCDSVNCPVGLALKRNNIMKFMVSPLAESDRVRINMFTRDFDAGREVKPFEFNLNLTDNHPLLPQKLREVPNDHRQDPC